MADEGGVQIYGCSAREALNTFLVTRIYERCAAKKLLTALLLLWQILVDKVGLEMTPMNHPAALVTFKKARGLRMSTNRM